MKVTVKPLQAPGAANGVDAAGLSAAAGESRVGDDRTVSPFAGQPAGAEDQLSVDHQSAADPGSQNDPEDDAGPLAGASPGLGEGEGVGVVDHHHPAAQGRLQVCGGVASVETRHVGANNEPRVGIDHPGKGQGHRRVGGRSFGHFGQERAGKLWEIGQRCGDLSQGLRSPPLSSVPNFRKDPPTSTQLIIRFSPSIGGTVAYGQRNEN